MKKTILVISALLGICAIADAQNVDGVSIDTLRMSRNGEYLVVDMNIDMSGLKVDSNRAVLLTPIFVNGTDTLSLSSIGVYGRRRYFYYVRNGESMLSGDGEMTYRSSEKPEKVDYHTIFPYSEWMNGGSLLMHRKDYGCCNTLLAEQTGRLGSYEYTAPLSLKPYLPALAYLRPIAESEKHFSLSGSAFIDFPVNQTVIYSDYRRNTVELAKIQATIDSVCNDRDIRITSVWLKGYASPESPYAHNTELAKGRTAALKKHIQQLYHFEPNVIATDYEPEDWDGLRRYVDKSNLAHRGEILAMIDSDLEPDAKELKIRCTYPEEYRFLLQICFTALRNSDFWLVYTVSLFNDVEEIKRVMKIRPQKLSLNEFYLAAQTYESGSDEFNEVFETAVRMYPDDPTANLNAANTALQRGDMAAAERYLAKSGESAEATYTRGVYELMNKNYDAAEQYMLRSKSEGVTQADETLQQIAKLKENNTNN